MANNYGVTLLVLLGFACCFASSNAICNGVVRNPDPTNDTLVFTKPKPVIVTTPLQTDFDGKGLDPWYDVAKSFVHTVQKDDIPYEELNNARKGSSDFDAPEFLKGWELPFLVVFAIGVLFAIIVPIVGFCFCCCRCCGNCGGEMSQKQTEKAGLKRALFGIFLAVITLIMFAGCLMAFVSNDRITDTVDSFRTTPKSIFDAANEYFNKTLDVITDNVFDNVLCVLDIVTDDVVKLPRDISENVKRQLDAVVKVPLKSVVDLGDKTEKMKEKLACVKNKTIELQERSKALKDNITAVEAECGCSLGGGADFDNLPNVTNELNSVNDVLDKDFIQIANDGLKAYEDIEEKIRNKTSGNVQRINDETEKARNTFEKETKKDITDKLNDQVFDKTDQWKKDVDKYFDDFIKPYDKYRYYAGVGLTCLILLPVVLMALGLLCGIFGHDKGAEPTERGKLSHMGGNCLMAAVGFFFIFVFFLMLFTSLMFIFGAHLEKACSGVRDETLFTEFLDLPENFDGKYILADAFFNNGSIKLTISGVLGSCRDNKALYEAIQGARKWDLKDLFNVSKKLGDFREDIRTFDVPVKDQKILDNATLDNLRELGNSGVDNINFTAFFTEINKDIVPGIDHTIANLTAFNQTDTAEKLRKIKAEADAMKVVAKELEYCVTELKRLGGDLSSDSNKTIGEVQKAETEFKGQVNGAVKTAANAFADKILGYIDQTTQYSIDLIENDLGKCKILTDIYDAAVNLLCQETVYPLNGFWFALGFCMFFYIPAIVLSVKLAKHYRRMQFEEGFDRHNGIEMSHVGDRNAVYPK